MAGKAHGNGDRRGDNTICGLGDRLRRLTAGICLITQTIFLLWLLPLRILILRTRILPRH